MSELETEVTDCEACAENESKKWELREKSLVSHNSDITE